MGYAAHTVGIPEQLLHLFDGGNRSFNVKGVDKVVVGVLCQDRELERAPVGVNADLVGV